MSHRIVSNSAAIGAALALAGGVFWFVPPSGGTSIQSDGRLGVEPAGFEVRADSSPPEPQQIEPRLVNRTDRVVRILEIETSCGCTAAGELETRTLAPGASVRLPLSITPPEHGSRIITVRVTTDHPTQRIVMFDIRSSGSTQDLPKLVRVSSSIRLTGRQAGERLSEEFALKTLEEKNSRPWIDQLKTDSSDILLQSLPIMEERALGGEGIWRTYPFRVTVPCPQLVNQRRENLLTLQFSRHPEGGTSPIRINAIREPMVKLIPEIVNFAFALTDSPMERIVIMDSEQVSDWSFRLVAELPPGVTINFSECSEAPSDSGKRIKVRVDPTAVMLPTGGVERFVLPIETSIPEQRQMDLPIVIQINPATNGT